MVEPTPVKGEPTPTPSWRALRTPEKGAADPPHHEVVRQALAAPHPAHVPARLPELDDQVVGGVADPGMDHLTHVDAEQVGVAGLAAGEPLLQGRVVDLYRPAGQLGVAGPGG